MKIWIKIALLTFLITNIAIELILIYVKGQEKDEIAYLYGEKLQSVATIVSALIDGDKYQELQFNNTPDIYSDQNYKDIKGLLITTKKKLNLKENIYTLSLTGNNSALFGVMTNDIPFAGDTLHLQSKAEKDALHEIYQHGNNVNTGIYDDQYGMWVSGIAPIFNSANRVVGVVQIDHESSLIYTKLNELNKRIFYFRLFLIPFIIFVSIVFSKIISRPLTKLTTIIGNISKGDYKESKPIRAFGEVKTLVDSTNLMRKTILEQQEKIFESMNQLKSHNKELLVAKEKAEEMTRLKNIFLANMSHELRTPLIGALGFTEILNDELDNPEYKEMTHGILKSMNRLLNTLNALLELSMIEANKVEIDVSDVNLKDLINQSLNIYEPSIRSKKLSLKIETPTEDIFIRTDAKLVQQAINNLLDNAVKFTSEGKIAIIVKINKLNDTQTCSIEIKDTGIGIPNDCFEMVFSEFRQASEGLSRKFEGTGLGLPIAKKYLALIKGKIFLDSQVGVGSTFTIVLPLDLA